MAPHKKKAHGVRVCVYLVKLGDCAMATPDMLSFMMTNFIEAMDFVMECAPNQRQEVLHYFTRAMDPDILMTVIKSWPQGWVPLLES